MSVSVCVCIYVYVYIYIYIYVCVCMCPSTYVFVMPFLLESLTVVLLAFPSHCLFICDIITISDAQLSGIFVSHLLLSLLREYNISQVVILSSISSNPDSLTLFYSHLFCAASGIHSSQVISVYSSICHE